MTIDIPQGSGVRCGDCKSASRVSENPPLYQENDPRLSALFRCPKQPAWRRMHEDLSHRCTCIEPAGEVRFYPLPSTRTRLALEQMAADPGNDRIAAGALAKKLYEADRRTIGSNRKIAFDEIRRIKEKNPLMGAMVEQFYEETKTMARISRRSAP